MKNMMFGAVLILLLFAHHGGQPALEQDQSFDVKGDHLGMYLEDFQKRHHDPGYYVYESKCEGAKCKPEQVWVPEMHCKNLSKAIVVCQATTTLAGFGANTEFLFADAKLAAIRVSFTFAGPRVTAVRDALTTKLGSPLSEKTGREGFLLVWANNVSAAAFQEHECMNGQAMVNGPLEGWSKDISYVIEQHYCSREDALNYNYSRIIYVSKDLSAVVQSRIDDAKKEAADRARKDI